MEKYKDKSLPPKERAKDLLGRMTDEEKACQLSSQILFDVLGDEYKKRDFRLGSFRNPGHFMHWKNKKTSTPEEVAHFINEDVRKTTKTSRFGIPPIENGEALHGAQWGMTTCFPQPIALAATFDKDLVSEIADVIGKETAAAGVRQVFAPVVNISRDCRWGRTMETFGEDVLLCSDMGEALTRGFQNNGVIASPKHFVDNYADGGRDSNESHSSQRTLYEVYLQPFKRCIQEGGAMSVMAAYNSVDGVPCSANRKLLTDILRGEWGFEGFVVSDYNGVEDVCRAHHLAENEVSAQAACLNAGLDVTLPNPSENRVLEALKLGLIDKETLDRAAYRVLYAKFKIGLFDDPYADEENINALIRSEKHKKTALKGARDCMVLLKNDGVLPFDVSNVKTIGVFGEGADTVPIGENYSGPYKGWRADDAHTPLTYLKEFAGEGITILTGENEKIPVIAPLCDICLYFTKMLEGEGRDRCNITLSKNERVYDDGTGKEIIVDAVKAKATEDQENAIITMFEHNKNSAVILLNGAPVDMTGFIDHAGAVLEAWYPGEQGAQAICEVLFGLVSPSGKLPMSFPKSVGQLPLYYSYKPSGRGYHYNENDGNPLFEFGYGLSYSKFNIGGFRCSVEDNSLLIEYDIENTGGYDAAEVVQIYTEGRNCCVVRPVSELKSYKKIRLKKKESAHVSQRLDEEAFSFYDVDLKYGMFDGDYIIKIGTSSKIILQTYNVRVRNGKLVI